MRFARPAGAGRRLFFTRLRCSALRPFADAFMQHPGSRAALLSLVCAGVGTTGHCCTVTLKLWPSKPLALRPAARSHKSRALPSVSPRQLAVSPRLRMHTPRAFNILGHHAVAGLGTQQHQRRVVLAPALAALVAPRNDVVGLHLRLVQEPQMRHWILPSATSACAYSIAMPSLVVCARAAESTSRSHDCSYSASTCSKIATGLGVAASSRNRARCCTRCHNS